MLRRRRIVRESTISSLSVTVYPTPPDDVEALAAALHGGVAPGTAVMTRRMSSEALPTNVTISGPQAAGDVTRVVESVLAPSEAVARATASGPGRAEAIATATATGGSPTAEKERKPAIEKPAERPQTRKLAGSAMEKAGGEATEKAAVEGQPEAEKPSAATAEPSATKEAPEKEQVARKPPVAAAKKRPVEGAEDVVAGPAEKRARLAPKTSPAKPTIHVMGKEIRSGRRRKRTATGGGVRGASFALYIYRVLKQVHPDMGISASGMKVMNSLVTDVFERIATEASRLARINKRATLTAREVQTAVRLLFPGELAKHAVSEGVKAVAKFSSG